MKHAGFLTIIKLLGLDKQGRMRSWDANKAQSKPATHVPLASVSYRRRAFLPTEALWLLGVRTRAPFNCKPLKGCRSPEKHGRPKQCEPALAGLVRPHEDGQPPPLLQPPGGKRWRPKRASPPAQQATWGHLGLQGPPTTGLRATLQAGRPRLAPARFSQAPLLPRNMWAEVSAILKHCSPNQTAVTVTSFVQCHYLCLCAGDGGGEGWVWKERGTLLVRDRQADGVMGVAEPWRPG